MSTYKYLGLDVNEKLKRTAHVKTIENKIVKITGDLERCNNELNCALWCKQNWCKVRLWNQSLDN